MVMRRVVILIGLIALRRSNAARLIHKNTRDGSVQDVQINSDNLSDPESGGGGDGDPLDGIDEQWIEEIIAEFDDNVSMNWSLDDDRMQYDFRHIWDGLDFKARWDMFRREENTDNLQNFWNEAEDVGPVCHPTLAGPKDSEKLAILVHGFLACPGMWYRVVPQLINAGFQVMLVVLPGHGRKFTRGSSGEVVDTNEFNLSSQSALRKQNSEVTDDIDDIPTTAQPYLLFADALQRLAAQWKREHPHGRLVAAGHSLGGAITAKFAMEIPHVVDSVLLMSPMLGLKWKTIETFANLLPSKRLSKGSSCERKRGTGSGGVCQFRLANVLAMADFAFAVLCCQWGMEHACSARYNMPQTIVLRTLGILNVAMETNLTAVVEVWKRSMRRSVCHQLSESRGAYESRQALGQMRGIQVVTSKGDNLVDNAEIEAFVDIVQRQRVSQPWGISSRDKRDFCKWGSDVGHAYMSNRGSITSKWWHPYIENVVSEFLKKGENFDISERSTGGDYCFKGPKDVAGSFLSRLPATQHRRDYWVGTQGVLWPSRAKVLFQGEVVKESEWRKLRNARQIEILHYVTEYLIVTRLSPHANVRDIFKMRKEPILVSREEGDCCMRPMLDKVSDEAPLHEALQAVSNSSTSLRFCGKGFLKVMCREIGCKTNADGTKASERWLLRTCSERMVARSKSGESSDDSTTKIRLRGDIVVEVPGKETISEDDAR